MTPEYGMFKSDDGFDGHCQRTTRLRSSSIVRPPRRRGYNIGSLLDGLPRPLFVHLNDGTSGSDPTRSPLTGLVTFGKRLDHVCVRPSVMISTTMAEILGINIARLSEMSGGKALQTGLPMKSSKQDTL